MLIFLDGFDKLKIKTNILKIFLKELENPNVKFILNCDLSYLKEEEENDLLKIDNEPITKLIIE